MKKKKEKEKRKIQIVMLGESGVGKTALVQRFYNDTFTAQHLSTLGIDFVSKEMMVEGKAVLAKIWDTAGQERFSTITKTFYKQAHGILLVFDLTDQKSYEKLHFWIQSISENADDQIVKCIVGNKCDLTESRVISIEDAQLISSQYDIPYIETSAKCTINTDKVYLNNNIIFILIVLFYCLVFVYY